jgi:hypothetical protein
LGFAFDLLKFVEYVEKELLPEFGEDIKLDEAMPELGGLTIRDAISSFTGEFLASITDVKMPDPASMGGFPGGPGVAEDNPFGDDAHAEDNPMEDSPFPGPGAPGGFPGGGPPRWNGSGCNDDGRHAQGPSLSWLPQSIRKSGSSLKRHLPLLWDLDWP